MQTTEYRCILKKEIKSYLRIAASSERKASTISLRAASSSSLNTFSSSCFSLLSSGLESSTCLISLLAFACNIKLLTRILFNYTY